jgi:hypothetical protein
MKEQRSNGQRVNFGSVPYLHKSSIEHHASFKFVEPPLATEFQALHHLHAVQKTGTQSGRSTALTLFQDRLPLLLAESVVWIIHFL